MHERMHSLTLVEDTAEIHTLLEGVSRRPPTAFSKRKQHLAVYSNVIAEMKRTKFGY